MSAVEQNWPRASHVEINGGIQVGPSKLTGAFGTRLIVRDWGHMTFWVEAVDVEGNRDVLYDGRSYEEAIVCAEEEARAEDVEVRDMVGDAGDPYRAGLSEAATLLRNLAAEEDSAISTNAGRDNTRRRARAGGFRRAAAIIEGKIKNARRGPQ